MDLVPKDVVVLILAYLDAKSVVAVAKCARRYAAYYRSDNIWVRLVREEFGRVEKSDVEPVAKTWWSVYCEFMRALEVALAAETRIFKAFVNRKSRNYYVDDQGLQALLFRRLDASMVIPIQTPWIKPRRGDTFVDLRRFGYRNEGISFWNGTHRVCCETDVDDYGSPPLEFSYPEFPFGYFYCGHGRCWNIKISAENAKEIEEEDTLTLEGCDPISWGTTEPKVGDIAVYMPDCDVFVVCALEESRVYETDEEQTDEFSEQDE